MGSALPGTSRNSSEFHGTAWMKGYVALASLTAATSIPEGWYTATVSLNFISAL